MTLYRYPSTPAGEEITEPMLQGMLPLFVEKTDINGRTVSTVSNDPDLSFPVPANSRWWVEMHLIAAGGATGDIKTAWSVPAGTTGVRRCHGPAPTATDNSNGYANVVKFGVFSLTSLISYGMVRTTNGDIEIVEKALVPVGTTAGNITLQWAQFVADATPAYIRPGSLIKAYQLA